MDPNLPNVQSASDHLEFTLGRIFLTGNGSLVNSNYPGVRLSIRKDTLQFIGLFVPGAGSADGLLINKQQITTLARGWFNITLIITGRQYDFIQFSPRLWQRKKVLTGFLRLGYEFNG
jgi:hypothetical protein